MIKSDADFARKYAELNMDAYESTVIAMRDKLLDRDTAPGAEPEELLKLTVPALVVPGRCRKPSREFPVPPY